MKTYDWQKTLSFDALITMVITARGYGKTYGLRCLMINDWIKRNLRTVVVVRHDKKINKIASGYFNKVRKDFPGWFFKVKGDEAYISKDEKKWEQFVYFVSMTSKQDAKERTFDSVKHIVFDECLIEKDDEFHHYLYDEWGKLTSIVNSAARERENSVVKPRLILSGNACGMVNPFFETMRVQAEPPRGYSWWLDKLVLLDYHDDPVYSAETKKTLAGKMELAQHGDNGSSMALDNRFTTADADLLMKKTSRATHLFTLIWRETKLAVWLDITLGLYFVTSKTPKDGRDTYTLSFDNGTLNYPLLRKSDRLIRMLFESFSKCYVRFDNSVTWSKTIDLLRFCGYL